MTIEHKLRHSFQLLRIANEVMLTEQQNVLGDEKESQRYKPNGKYMFVMKIGQINADQWKLRGKDDHTLNGLIRNTWFISKHMSKLY